MMWAVALYGLAGYVYAGLAVVAIICAGLAVWVFRRWFRVRVSCWFCQAVVKVPFRERNCWDCPHCDQYNGFTETGDYNKSIPAMYGEAKNSQQQQNFTQLRPRYSPPLSEVSLDTGNGLCGRCNKNQALKIRQLANFVPSCEELFDEELKAFQRRLEQIYALCFNCREIVRSELTNQQAKLGYQTSPKRPKSDLKGKPQCRQRRDTASPGRVGNMLGSLNLGFSDSHQRPTSSILAPARFQPPSSSPSSLFRLSGGSSSLNEQSFLWPNRFPSPKKTTYDEDAVSVFSSVSQRFRRPTRTDDSKCSHTANSTDGFWKCVACLVLLCSFSTNALVLYFLLCRGG